MIKNKKLREYSGYIIIVLVLCPVIVYWLTKGISDTNKIDKNLIEETVIVNNDNRIQTIESISNNDNKPKAKIEIKGIGNLDIEKSIQLRLQSSPIKSIVFIHPELIQSSNQTVQPKYSQINIKVNNKICQSIKINFNPLLPNSKIAIQEKLNKIIRTQVEGDLNRFIQEILLCIE